MSAFFEWMKMKSMDDDILFINSEIWYIFCSISVISTSFIVSTFICARKKPSPPPPQSLKKAANSSNRPSAIFSAPLSQPQLLNPPIQQTAGGGAKSAVPAGSCPGSNDKLQGSDGPGGKKPAEQQSNNETKQSGDQNVDKKTTDIKKPDTEKKESEKPEDDKKAVTKEGTKETGGTGTKDATKEPTADSKIPPATSPAPLQTPPQQQQQQQPRGMEIHKSMKVRNKKKTPSPSAPSPGNTENNKTKGGEVKTKGTLKQNDGDDDEDDDDETLRGVTSLKIDPKVPFSVDEPAP